MYKFARPRIFASRCLGFEACRWNGAIINTEITRRLAPHVDFITDCPEVAIGLGIPRDPIRIIEHEGELELYQPANGLDLTEKMRKHTAGFLDSMPQVDGFILQARSPSCGPWDVKIYNGRSPKAQTLRRAAGFFGGEVLSRFGSLPVEDEGRLTNFTIRERFYTQIFTLAEFRAVRASGRASRLVEFMSHHKLLLMACHQREQKTLGHIAASHEGLPFDMVLDEFETHLLLALHNGPRRNGAINALMHALGYFKKELKTQEKRYFLELLDEFRNSRIPLSSLNSVIKAWIERSDESYLRMQSFFEPYPSDLVDISDSGAGRDY